jgi:hypothetical protein
MYLNTIQQTMIEIRITEVAKMLPRPLDADFELLLMGK